MEAITYLPLLFALSKDEWDTKRMLVSPLSMHCTYSGMARGSWAEVTSEQQKNLARSLSHCRITLASVSWAAVH